MTASAGNIIYLAVKYILPKSINKTKPVVVEVLMTQSTWKL